MVKHASGEEADRKPGCGVPGSQSTPCPIRIRQGVFHNQVIFNGAAADQVFLNDPLDNFGCAGVIPSSIRVYHRRRSALAYLKTIRLRPVDAACTYEVQLAEAPLEILP